MTIAIVGAGITGLSTALAMKKLGFTSAVFEKAAGLNEVGAGILIQPNGLQVLEWLGLKEKVVAAGHIQEIMEVTDARFVPFKRIQKETLTGKYGHQSVAIHRVELQKILRDEVLKYCQIYYDNPYLNHQSSDEAIRIHFENKVFNTCVLLGCDGIYSKVRQQIFPHTVLRNTYQICWRGISNFHLPEHLKGRSKEVWGKGIRFGFANVAEDKVYWFAVAKHHNNLSNIGKDAVIDLFKNLNPMIEQIMSPTEYIHEDIIRDLKRLPAWYQGNVCLMGDAAHATTPNMGQGACQGMEDAYYLAHFLSQSATPRKAFTAFETQRRAKVDFVVNNSWRFGKLAHHGLGQALIKTVMRLTPQSVLKKQMDNLYHLEEYTSTSTTLN